MEKDKLETVIESRRKELGLTKKAIYEGLGMSSVGYYQMLERGTITLKNLLLLADILKVDVSYLLDNSQSNKDKFNKPLDGGKFGSEIEEELRAQIDMLKSQLAETNRNNEFLRKMMERLTDGFEKIAESVGKEAGAEAKCLPLLPDEAPDAIKMRA